MNALGKKDFNILFIQDTRLSPSIENKVKAEWGGKAFFSSFTSQARGVAIFIKKDVPIDILNRKNDKDGNILSLLVKFNDKRLLLTTIYGPNTDSPDFYLTKVFKLIDEWQPDFPIFGGDWNMVLDQRKDTHNYLHDNNVNARNVVLKKIEEENLIDPWRSLHPVDKRFTWSNKGSTPRKFARLDFFLVSIGLMPYITKTKIMPGFQSDHSSISIHIDFNKFCFVSFAQYLQIVKAICLIVMFLKIA